jgi:Pup-like protein
MDTDDLLAAAASAAKPSHEDVQDEVKAILDKIKAGMGDMNEEEMEEFRKGFVGKLAEKVRQATAGEAERVATGLGQGLYTTLAAFLILIVLFGETKLRLLTLHVHENIALDFLNLENFNC